MTTGQANVAGLHHVSIPVRNRPEAMRFWKLLLGSDYIEGSEDENFSLVSMPGGVGLGLSEQPRGWTAPAAEYPHYAFRVEPDKIEGMKAKLDAMGIPTHSIWTRFQKEALMYFRDPSGNLFEFFCPEGYPKAKSIPVGSFYGGEFTVDLEALNYDRWNDPGR